MALAVGLKKDGQFFPISSGYFYAGFTSPQVEMLAEGRTHASFFIFIFKFNFILFLGPQVWKGPMFFKSPHGQG